MTSRGRQSVKRGSIKSPSDANRLSNAEMFQAVIWCVLLVSSISGKAVREAPGDGSAEKTNQCEFNGIKYNEGEELPTRHMCFNCRCTKDFVEPSTSYCDVIECPKTQNLERGCEPIYNQSDCCPVNWNCDNAQSPQNECQCEQRYFKHYEVKGCSPEYKEGCSCPVRFQCSPEETKKDKTVCNHRGRTYQPGENIETSNPCEICSCQMSDAASITCIPVECPSLFRPPQLEQGCYEVFESDKCCSVRTECSSANETQAEEKKCVYNGKTYHVGQKIYPEEDPCLICRCTEDWSGIHGSSCHAHDCMLDRKLRQLQRGCLPIYHEKTCCPIEFYCGSEEEGFKNETLPLANAADIDSGDACVFKGQHYAIGQYLDINHPTNCVSCHCSTPPDFTCIHKSCPGPPNDDYENCKHTYTKGQCCSTYNCETKPQARAFAPVPQCAPVYCPEGCSEVTVQNSCPFCKCNEVLCTPPKCVNGCEVEVEVDPGQCPGCKCPHDVLTVPPMCAPVKCGPSCFQVNNPGECPSCLCGTLCSPPKCEEGCMVQPSQDVQKGGCPGCVCSDSGVDKRAGDIQCSPVQCPSGCAETIGESGCPTCSCPVLMCSPPKCDEGCFVDPEPNGVCPGCICDSSEISLVESVQCAPVKCGPHCRAIRGESGCPMCQCSPLCSPPHCDLGCHIEYNPEVGPCPVCVCDRSQIGVLCSPPKCDEGCSIDYSTSPCPSCSCNQEVPRRPPVLCSPPKCDPGCHIDYSSSPCPSCSCDNNQDRIPLTVQCSPPRCDAGCHIDFSSSPCPSCSCESDQARIPLTVQCSPPKCDPGCYTDYSSSPCPSCSCDQPKNPVLCSPPKCDPGCHIDYSSSPCPSCSCDNNQPRNPVLCSPPKCDPECHIDYSSSPCPSCSCDNNQPRNPVLCSPPKCDPGCHIDHSSSPCPSCSCDNNEARIPLTVQCSPPKCDQGCHIDYSSAPCPSCSCDQPRPLNAIQCSTPKCDEGCHLDYSTTPCPSCKCEQVQTGSLTGVMCSPPKCDEGCHLDYTTTCPSCSCEPLRRGPLNAIQCSPPKCDEGCQLDSTTTPCPTCKCDRPRAGPAVLCSPLKCDDGCHVDYSTSPCPSCSCEAYRARPLCSPPNCGPGCHIDFTTSPCPSCKCDQDEKKFEIQCSPPKCEAGCHMDYSAKPCAVCSCEDPPNRPLCSPPNCGPGCHIDFTTSPCPSCKCDQDENKSSGIQCSTPKCESGCVLDFSSPCPSCKCDHISKRSFSRMDCGEMRCLLPCRIIKISEHACPSCQCYFAVKQCAPVKCNPGFVEKVISPDPCPQCVPVE